MWKVVSMVVLVAATTAAAAPGDDPLAQRVWSARPMVSPDGARIFMPMTYRDGSHGGPNLEYDLVARTGKPIRTLVIEGVDEDVEDGKLRERERQAAAMLDALAAAKFSPEPLVYIAADITTKHAELVQGGERKPSVTIDLNVRGELTVKPRGHAAITRRDAKWAGDPTPEQAREMQRKLDAGEVPCFNGGLLRGATVDVTHRLALVDVGFHGSDSCWEPDDVRVVIAW